jgi:hypothetical protein
MKVIDMKIRPVFALISLLGMTAAGLAGCVLDGRDTGRPTIEDVAAAQPSDGDVPDGAIWMSKGLYAVPVAVNDDGCEQFSQWAASGITQAVILYRDGKGGFSALKSEEASCNVEMINVGVDDSGCPVFRAEQPDGKVTGVVYYRSESGFTVSPERAICEGLVEKS